MPETYGNKQVVQGEDIILLVDDKTTLHATTHTLKVDLEMKELQLEYHKKFCKVLPAGVVLKIIRADEKFHRQAFQRMMRRGRR